jgi:hypothetical protein
MNITIKILDENPDGSANAQVTYDKEALEYMVEYAITGMLTEYVNKLKEEKKNAKAKPRQKRNTKVS